MNDLQKTIWGDAGLVEKFRHMATAELRRLLHENLLLTIDRLRQHAAMIRALEERGEDMSELKGLSLYRWLALIAASRLLPQLVADLVGKDDTLLRKMARMSVDDQLRFLENKPLPLVVLGDAGGRTHRMIEPAVLWKEGTNEQRAQLFGPDGFRDERAQNLFLDDQLRRRRVPVPETVEGITADPIRGGLIINRRFWPESAIRAALKALDRTKKAAMSG